MIIDSSEQVPRTTLLKRFPVPRDFNVPASSRIGPGRTWPAPAGAVRVKDTVRGFELRTIYATGWMVLGASLVLTAVAWISSAWLGS